MQTFEHTNLRPTKKYAVEYLHVLMLLVHLAILTLIPCYTTEVVREIRFKFQLMDGEYLQTRADSIENPKRLMKRLYS